MTDPVSKTPQPPPLRLHLGCGRNILPGYVNIDGDDKETIITRYKIEGAEADQIRSPGVVLVNMDMRSLPFMDQTVDEVLCEGVLEHIGFNDEQAVWTEMTRVLKPGGVLNISVPDFDALVEAWQDSDRHGWQRWWDPNAQVGDPSSYFGTGRQDINDRWGYLLTCFFGNQTSEHQYHRNAYNMDKLHGILRSLEYKSWDLTYERWKGRVYLDPMIRVKAVR